MRLERLLSRRIARGAARRAAAADGEIREYACCPRILQFGEDVLVAPVLKVKNLSAAGKSGVVSGSHTMVLSLATNPVLATGIRFHRT